MDSRTPLTINICSIRVSGPVGGLGMGVIVAAMVIQIPLARALFFAGVLAGAITAWILIRRRRDHVLGTPGDDLPMSLGLDPVDRRQIEPPSPDIRQQGLPRLAVGY